MLRKIFFVLFFIGMVYFLYSINDLSTDIVKVGKYDLKITFIGHGSLLFNYNDKNIYIDPYSKLYDYSILPKADLIIITHEHGDHLDSVAIDKIKTDKTQFILNQSSFDILKSGSVMKNNEKRNIFEIDIESVPAYNILNKRPNGLPFHPEGIGNGYIITFGDKRIYVAGDTENIPYMKNLKDVYIAFLPVNLPYTMTIDMAYNATMMFKPKILYPYHYSDTDIKQLVKMIDSKIIDVRIRSMK